METLLPIFKNHPQAIVFSADDNYAPYLAVTIKSLIVNSNPKSHYDIVVFDCGISVYRKNIIAQMCADYPQISLRFFDIMAFTEQFKSYLYATSYFSIAMYFRLFIPDIFATYSRVLYLDCDLVVNCDINQLLETPLQEQDIAAIIDENIASGNESRHANLIKYISQKLKIKDYHGYFNSGVLLFNISQLVKQNLSGNCMKLLKDHPGLWFPDQDLLNIFFEGKVKYLEAKWNFQWAGLLSAQTDEALAEIPCVIHYTSGDKPWNLPGKPLADQFWKYARQTDLYEAIIYNNLNSSFMNALTLLTQRQKIRWRYLVYKLMSKFTVGKLRLQSQALKKRCKEQLNQIKKLYK